MSSPFKVFRKNQKILIAVTGVMAMIAFVFLGQMGPGAAPARENPLVATTSYGGFHEYDFDRMIMLRQVTYQFLEEAYFLAFQNFSRGISTNRPTMQPPQADSSFFTKRSVLNNYLFARKAEELGFVVSDEYINHYLQQITGNGVTSTELQGLIRNRSLNDSRLSMEMIFRGIREELLAQKYLQTYQITYGNPTPGEQWEYFRRLNLQMKVEFLPIEVAKFVDQVKDPSEKELNEFFAKYASRPFNPQTAEVGFKVPEKKAFQFIQADFAKFVEASKKDVTEEEIKEYYERNKDISFRKLTLDDDAEPDDGKAQGTDDEKSEGGKPEKDPATQTDDTKPDTKEPGNDESGDKKPEDDKPESKETDSKKPEDDKPESKETDSKKPEDDKPEGKETDSKKPEDKTTEGSDSPEDKSDSEQAEKPSESKAENKESADKKPEDDKPGNDESGDKKPEDKKPESKETDNKKPEDEGAGDKKPEADDSSQLGVTPDDSYVVFQAEEEAAGDGDGKTSTPAAETATEKVKEEATAKEAKEADPQETPAAKSSETPEKQPEEKASPEKDAQNDSAKTTSSKENNPADSSAKGGEQDSKPAAPDPTTSKPAATDKATTDSTVTKPEEKVEYAPLGEVEDQIRSTLAEEKAEQKMNEALSELQKKTFSASRKYISRGRKKSALPDYQQWVADDKLSLHSTKLLSQFDLRATEFGQSFVQSSGSVQSVPFSVYAFTAHMTDYKGVISISSDRTGYLIWKTAETKENIPKLDEVRDQVVLAWKMVQARELAEKKAEELMESARSLQLPLMEAFADDKNFQPFAPPPFSWLSTGVVQTRSPRTVLSQVEGIEGIEEDFMEAISGLAEGGLTVVSNRPKTFYYVARLDSRDTSEDILRQVFLAMQRSPQKPWLVQAFRENYVSVNDALLADIHKQAKVDWLVNPDAPQSGEPQ